MDIVLGGVGAVIGGIVGGLPGAMLGLQIGGFVGGLFTSHKEQPAGKLDDLRVTSAGYGSSIPITYGSTLVGTNLIWSSDLKQSVRTIHQGKGIGGSSQDEYTYSASFAVGVCEGPIHGIGRIWADDILVYDSTQSKKSQYNIHDPYLGTEIQTADSLLVAANGVDYTPAYRGLAYIVFEGMPLASWGNRLPNIVVEVLGDTSYPLTVRDILEGVADKAGLVSTDVYFDTAWDTVLGFIIPQRDQAYNAISPLLETFSTDLVEVNGQILAQRRGGPSIATIPIGDLAAHDWSSGDASDPPSRIETTRAQQIGLPGAIDFIYVDPSRRYEQMTQRAVRYDKIDVQEPSTFNTYVTMSATSGRRRAEKMLSDKWLERDGHSISLSQRYSWLVPTNLITLTLGTQQKRLRIVSMDSSVFGEIKVTLVPDNNSIDDGTGNSISGGMTSLLGDNGIVGAGYRSGFDVGGGHSSANSLGVATTATATSSVNTEFDAWSGVELVAGDGSHAGFYVASSEPGSCYFSIDGGSNYSVAGNVPGGSILGLATTTLANGPGTPDTADSSTVAVVLSSNGPLASTSASGVTNGENWARVGNEVVSYQVATPTDATHFTLSTLIRGRRISPQSGHAIGDRFWVIDTSVVRIKVPASAIGTSVLVKVLGAGQALSDVTAISITIPTPVAPYIDTPTMTTAIGTAIAAIPGAHTRVVLSLCEAFTPSTTGADVAEFTVPGVGLTFSLTSVTLRCRLAGGVPSITIEKSTSTGVFTSAATIATVTLSSGAYEGSITTGLGTVNSGDKIRFNVIALGTAIDWTITMEATT